MDKLMKDSKAHSHQLFECTQCRAERANQAHLDCHTSSGTDWAAYARSHEPNPGSKFYAEK